MKTTKKMQMGGMSDSKKTPVKRIARLQKKENELVSKGNKAVDEGRDKKADRILGRAANVEDRKIRLAEMKKGGSLKDVPTGKVGLGKLPTEVRNKMGYKKNGGATAPKAKMGGAMKAKKK